MSTNPKSTALAERASDPAFARPEAQQFAMVPHMEMFEHEALFTHYQRVANLMSSAAIVPKPFQGKPADTFIALSIARATGQNPIIVMQSIYVADGRAGWYSRYLIARANMSGRLKPPGIRYDVKRGPKPIKANGFDFPDISVTAYADLAGVEGEARIEQTVTMQIAIDDGWIRNPKYRSIPERMLQWRAASWLVNSYIPEVMLGMTTAEEIEDGAIDDDAGPTERRQPATARPRRSDFGRGAGGPAAGDVIDVEPLTEAGTGDPTTGAEEIEMVPVLNAEGEVIAEAKDWAGARSALAGEIGRAKTVDAVNALLSANEHFPEEERRDAAAAASDRIADLQRAPKPTAEKPKDAKPKAEAKAPPPAEKPKEQEKPADPPPPADEPEKVEIVVKTREADLGFVLPDDATTAIEALDSSLIGALNNGGFKEAAQCWEANLPAMGELRRAGFSKLVDGVQDRHADRVKQAKKDAAAAQAKEEKPADPPPADQTFDDIPVITAAADASGWTAKFGEFSRVLRGDEFANKSPEWFQAFYERNRPVVDEFMAAMKSWVGPLKKAFEHRGVKA